MSACLGADERYVVNVKFLLSIDPSDEVWVETNEGVLTTSTTWSLLWSEKKRDLRAVQLIEEVAAHCFGCRFLQTRASIQSSFVRAVYLHDRNRRLFESIQKVYKAYFPQREREDPSDLSLRRQFNAVILQSRVAWEEEGRLFEKCFGAIPEANYLRTYPVPFDPESEVYQHNIQFLNELGKDPGRKAELIDHSEDRIEEASTFFGKKVGGYAIADTEPLLRRTWATLLYQLQGTYQTVPNFSDDMRVARFWIMIRLAKKRACIYQALIKIRDCYQERWREEPEHLGLPELRQLTDQAKKDCGVLVTVEMMEGLIDRFAPKIQSSTCDVLKGALSNCQLEEA